MASAVCRHDRPWARPRSVGGMGPGDHLCLTFDGEEEREHVVGAFARVGLHAGDKVLYVTDTPERSRVTALLGGWGIDPEPHLASGQLVVETATDLYLPGGVFDPDRTADALLEAVVSARAQGYRALRLTAEMGWALRGLPGSEHLLEFEGRLRGVLAAGPAMAICQYDRNVFHPAALENVTRVHQAPVTVDAEYDDGILRITRTFQPPGLRIEGEVDATTAGELERVLAAAASRGHGDVHVDLSCLEFIDLGGLRALVATADGLEGARSLVLRGVRPHLRRLIRLVGWEDTPGLVLEGGEA